MLGWHCLEKRELKETAFIVDFQPGTFIYIISFYPGNKTWRQVYYTPQFIDEETQAEKGLLISFEMGYIGTHVC